MLNGRRNTILLTPFGGISDEVPLVITFLCLSFERLVDVQVDEGVISDGIGSDGTGTVALAMAVIIA